MATFTILEPMSTGDVIDRAVRLYRRNFTPLIAIVTVPAIVGYLTSLMFSFGSSQMISASEGGGAPVVSGVGILLFIIGMIGYPVWFFTLMMTVAGLSRVIGDHVMMGEPITFRKCFGAVRRRLGDVILMMLLSLAIVVVLYIALLIVMFALVMVVGVVAGLSAAGLPPWLSAAVMIVAAVAGVVVGAAAILIVVARVVFLPQALMIEGQSAGSSLGRAIQLGKGNWHRVGAIVLFTYFVQLSLLAALMVPLVVALELIGVRTFEMFMTPTGSAIYGAFAQTANLLTLPIWVVSFTLLYFDSRVRREAYDMELLAQEIAPGFHWQPSYSHQVFARVPVQTSPLGLGGFIHPRQPAPPQEAVAAGAASGDGGQPESQPAALCEQCAAELHPGALFCIRCGAEVKA